MTLRGLAVTRAAALRAGPLNRSDAPIIVVDSDTGSEPQPVIAFLRQYKVMMADHTLTILE